jgi:hypothetical protein
VKRKLIRFSDHTGIALSVVIAVYLIGLIVMPRIEGGCFRW